MFCHCLLLYTKYFPQTAEEERFVTVCSFRTLGLWLLGPWATQNIGTVWVCHESCLLLPRSRREHDPKESWWGGMLPLSPPTGSHLLISQSLSKSYCCLEKSLSIRGCTRRTLISKPSCGVNSVSPSSRISRVLSVPTLYKSSK